MPLTIEEQVSQMTFIPHPSFLEWNKVTAVAIPPIPVFRLAMGTENEGKHTVLTKEQEKYLFLKYNYLRYRIKQYSHLDRLTRWQKTKINKMFVEMRAVEKDLVNSNMAMVAFWARKFEPRYRKAGNRFDMQALSELFSAGLLPLLRCIKGFDVRRNWKFSTYACRSLIHEMTTYSIRETKKTSRNVRMSEVDIYAGDLPECTFRAEVTDVCKKVREFVQSKLDEREAKVIHLRLLANEKATLEDIGRRFDPPVSKERIRQIQNVALKKLKNAMLLDGFTADACLS